MNKSRTNIAELVRHLVPFDDLEASTITAVTEWIMSGVALYRGERSDAPDPHLVVYFVLVDLRIRKILLVNHRKAGLWLPTGGHVEPDEDPRAAVRRELAEELGPHVSQSVEIASAPLFITSTRTRGSHSHTDITLWYVVSAREGVRLSPDIGEFKAVAWYGFDEIIAMPADQLDPQMHRFLQKLEKNLA